MLQFSDQPYRYFPPKRVALTAWLLTLQNRFYYLPRVKQIMAVEVTGSEVLKSARRSTDRLLFAPNHPTHADPQIYLEALRQIGITSQMMAAYDVFLRRKRDAWVMQRLGCFSVDREGSDAQAMKQASTVLRSGKHALTIFPEGNVYLLNDLVTPFHDGAAMLALRAAKDLSKQDRRVLVVPVSIKVTYVVDVQEQVKSQMKTVADAVQTEIKPDMPMLDQLKQVGVQALGRNLRHRGIEVDDCQDLAALIESSAGKVLEKLEAKMQLTPRPGDGLTDRVRQARRAIHQVRTDADRVADHEAAAVWADEAMLAYRIASYRGDYVRSKPTVDRMAETVQKLGEDVFSSEQLPLGPRRAVVNFGEPIDTGDYLNAFKQKARQGVRLLTEDIEQSVQTGVDAINERNSEPGGQLWRDGG